MKEYNLDDTHIVQLNETEQNIALATDDLHVWYGPNEAIKGVSLQFEKNKITSLIGPSGCGKSTYLRSLNRMNDEIDGTNITGNILYKNTDLNS